jgi:hypothetical protein
VCEVTPQANSPSPELAIEFAPPIHSDKSNIDDKVQVFFKVRHGTRDVFIDLDDMVEFFLAEAMVERGRASNAPYGGILLSIIFEFCYGSVNNGFDLAI